MMLNRLIAELNNSGCSCIIANGETVRKFTERGVTDLYKLSKYEPDFLKGALIVDKIVGKGAATLLVSSKVRELYTHVISKPALELLIKNGVDVNYETLVPNIINRDKTGFCPLETLCNGEELTIKELLQIIDNFMQDINNKCKK